MKPTSSPFPAFLRAALPVAGLLLAAVPSFAQQDGVPVRRPEVVTPAPAAEPPTGRAVPANPAPAPAAEPPTGKAVPAEPAPAPPPPPAAKPATAPAAKPPAKSSAAGQAAANPEQTLFDYAYEICYKQGNYDLAVQSFGEFLKTYPRHALALRAKYLQAESHLQLNHIDDAETLYRDILKNYKTSDYIANAAYRLASLAYTRKEFKTAAAFFGTSADNTKVEKIRISSWYYRARCLQETDQPKLAAAELQKLVKIKQDNGFYEKSLLLLARIAEQGGETEVALKNYKELATSALDPEIRGEAIVKSGLLASQLGKDTEALESFQRAMQLKDDKSSEWRAIGRYGLIESYYKAADFKKVVESYLGSEAVQLPDNLRPKMWLMVGNAYRNLQQWRRAVDIYLMLDQYFPKSQEAGEAGYRRLLCLNEMKDPALPGQAEAVIGKLKESQPNSEQIDLCRFLVAEFFLTKNEFGSASKWYSGIRTDKLPENLRLPCLFRRGWAAQEAGENTSAVTALGQFIASAGTDPNVPRALALRGMAYKGLQNWASAQADFDQIIAKYPGAGEEEIAYEQSALIRGQRDDRAGMIATFTKLLEKFPKTKAAPSAHFWIGRANFELKKYADALIPLDQARRIDAKTYDKEASLMIILSYYYLPDFKNLTTQVEGERQKEGGDQRVPSLVYRALGLKAFEVGENGAADKWLTLHTTYEKPADKIHSQVWSNLAEARLANGHFDGAVTASDNFLATQQVPQVKAKTFLTKGRALLGLKKYEDANKAAQEALDLQPEAGVEARIRLLMGDVQMAQGQFETAAGIYGIPGIMFDDPVITPLALWKTAGALEKAGQADKAAKTREDLKKRFPKFTPPAETAAAPPTTPPAK